MPEHAWSRIGGEGETVTVPPDSTVRYGATPAARYVERVVSGQVFIHNQTFTDPEVGVPKALWLRSDAAEAPTPIPSPPPSPEPNMPIVLPTIPDAGAYPATGTDAQKDQWLRLAALHMSAANVRANEALADVHRQLLEQQGSFNGSLGTFVENVGAVWDRLDASIARLAAAVEASPGGAPGSGDGVTAEDAAIVGQILQASRGG